MQSTDGGSGSSSTSSSQDVSSALYGIDTSKYKPDTGSIPSSAENIASRLLGIITVFGVVISVILLAMIGFEYIIGSASEKAADKQKLIGFLIGAVLLTAGSGIIKLIYDSVSGW